MRFLFFDFFFVLLFVNLNASVVVVYLFNVYFEFIVYFISMMIVNIFSQIQWIYISEIKFKPPVYLNVPVKIYRHKYKWGIRKAFDLKQTNIFNFLNAGRHLTLYHVTRSYITIKIIYLRTIPVFLFVFFFVLIANVIF